MDAVEFNFVSLNLRTIKDRWIRRCGTMLDQLAAAEPDVIALQEASTWSLQARFVAWRLGERGMPSYAVRHVPKRGWKGFLEGLAVLSARPIVRHGSLDLGGDSRVAQRTWIEVSPGRVVDVVNVHLANGRHNANLRAEQVARLLEWIGPSIQRRPVIVVGDFNAEPDSIPIRAMVGRLRSAHILVHGAEPVRTAPAIPPADGWPGHVIDYIFVNELVDVRDCRVAFTEPSHRHPHVYASDHLGLVARLSLR